MKLGRKLRRARIERDATQAQVAQALGVTQPMIAMIERGEEPGDELHEKILRWISGGATPGKSKRGPYRTDDK